MTRIHTSWRIAGVLLATFGTFALLTGTSSGQTTYTFITQSEPTTFVDWHDASVWSPSGVPNAPGDAVIFNRPTVLPSVPFSVILDQDATIGSLTVDNTGFNQNQNLILDMGGTLTFQATSGPATWTETQGGDNAGRFDLWPNIVLQSDLVTTLNNRANLNTSSFLRGVITGSTTRTITKNGSATLQLEHHGGSGFQGQYIINEGGLRFTGSSNISQSTGITVHEGGQLQLNANAGGAEFHDWTLANGAELHLNSLGRDGLAGALRFQGAGSQDPRHSNFHSPVVLDSDSRISVGPAQVTGELTNVVSGDGGLIKNAPGTLILSNPGNSYAGDTTIQGGGGTLSFSHPVLADAADVYLATGTFLNLNFMDTDSIGSFFIDGVAQAVGTYGALGNGVTDFEIGLITGTGILDVTTLPGLAGDYNGDGVVDAADYVAWRRSPGDFGGDPEGYNTWRANFGVTSSGSGGLAPASTVPEPGTVLLALLSLTGVVAARARGVI
jgi:autotransporter-associated beta strand protein